MFKVRAKVMVFRVIRKNIHAISITRSVMRLSGTEPHLLVESARLFWKCEPQGDCSI